MQEETRAADNERQKRDAKSNKPEDLDFIDYENVDWEFGIMNQHKNNPYSQPTTIRGDLIFKCTRFGYDRNDILKSVINNMPNH